MVRPSPVLPTSDAGGPTRPLAWLSPTDRRVVRLCLHDGLSAAEAARRLGRTPQDVEALLARVAHDLRDDLREEQGEDEPPAS